MRSPLRAFLPATLVASLLTMMPIAPPAAGAAEATVTHERAGKALVERFVRISNAHDYAALPEVIAADFVRHCQATPGLSVASREQFEAYLRADAIAFPDGAVSLQTTVAEGDRVAFWGSYTGTQNGEMGPFPATGRRVAIDISGIFRIEAGKIAELWIVWDNLSVLGQLGLLPTDEAPGDDEAGER